MAGVTAVPSILSMACRITGMGFAAVARVTEERWIACATSDRIGFGLRPGDELEVETTICHEIRQHQRPVIISNVAEDACFRPHHTPALYGFQSYISIPIILPDGSFFGTLCAIDPEPRDLDRPEIIGTFRLFAELIACHLDAGMKLAASETALLQERELSELREQFIAVLGHDLRNPLASVAAGMRIILHKPEMAAEVAAPMQQSISRMSGLIDDVLDFARGRLGGGMSMDMESDLPIGPVLMQVVQEQQSTHSGCAIESRFDLDEPVRCDHRRMAQLLSNLLGNALTHGAPSMPVVVRAVARGGRFELSVANSGEPISPAAMKQLFQPFVRGAVRPNQEGLGLGLFIVAEIARAHGGQIEVSSTRTETRFTFRMPTASGQGMGGAAARAV
ncbi:GAF domain-containing sensor histidine kinase [Teichococcus coralli]|uniref:GAF domain-containing sensor histidine kinase n=1 Tax=Teichococcus coralli TaxID=2545983 RepID=UPI003461E51E